MTEPLKVNDSVSSVMKIFRILEAISDEPEIGITELSQIILMPKSTVYRFLQTMKTIGYVSQEGDRDKYSLTLKLFELGARALQYTDLIKSSDAKMSALSKITKETSHLGILDKDSIVYVHKIDSLYSLRMHSRIGKHNPLYSTAIGKVLLAWLDEAEIRDILKNVELVMHTENTLTSVDLLINELVSVRKLGYSMDNEEMEAGLLCISVPIYNRFDIVIAGLSLSFPSIRFDDVKKCQYITLLHQYAAEISLAMGSLAYPKFASNTQESSP
ncbi:KDG regulon transcriptional repressor [Gammaproteobacteria bacterium]|nr:KDG regulon transcriptional repressor [Gammaproteobacteria bacterium]